MRLIAALARLATGNLAARLIVLASTPILTRLYTPEDFGHFYSLIGVTAVAIPVVSLSYANAIPLARHDRRAMAISVWCLLAAFTLTPALVLLLLCITFALGNDGFVGEIGTVIAFALLVLASVLIEVSSGWLTRVRLLGITAKGIVLKSLTSEFSKIGFGIVIPSTFGLIISQFLGAALASAYLLRMLPIAHGKHALRKLSYLWLVLVKYREFALFRMPAQVLSSYGVQAPVLLLALSYGATQAGYVALAVNMISVPVSLFGQSLNRALFSELAHALRQQNPARNSAKKIFTQGIFLSALIGFPASIFMFAAAPFIFPRVFGIEWVQAGNYVSIMSIYVFFQFLSYPVLSVLNFSGAQSRLLSIHGQRAALATAILLIVPATGADIVTTLWFYSAALCAHYMLSFLYTVRSFNRYLHNGSK